MPASPDRQWSTEEDSLIRSLIKQGLPLKDMPPQLPKRTLRGIQCRVYTLGLKSGQPRTKYSKNEAFWETPNPLNSYYAGLLAADGSIGVERETVSWTCEHTDKPAMEAFVQAAGHTGGIKETVKRHGGGVSHHCYIQIAACQKWNADLARNFNVVPQKTHRLAPPIFANDLLACCYLIGYTDGDGCIHAGKDGLPQISFVSASRAIIEWIQAFIERHFRFKLRDRQAHILSPEEGAYHRLCIYGMQAIKLFDFLHRIDVPKFARKWDNPAFLAIVEAYRQKWPEFFAADKELTFNADGNIVPLG